MLPRKWHGRTGLLETEGYGGCDAKAKPTNNGKVNAPDTSKMAEKDKQHSRKVPLRQFGKMPAGQLGETNWPAVFVPVAMPGGSP